jgi:dipeptidyl aminopeptidase/acylaminoacyl peptidase
VRAVDSPRPPRARRVVGVDIRIPATARIAAALSALLLLGLPAATAAAAPEAGLDRAKSLAPHLLLIHGGAFLGEDPTFRPLTQGPAAAAGFVTHYLDYPLGDLPAAVRAARAEARRLRARFGAAVYAYGSSAGGTLAAILAGDGLVNAAVAKAPPSDLVTWSWPLEMFGPDYHERIRANPGAVRRLSPLRRPARRPLLVVHGRQDSVVPFEMSEAFAAKFQRVHLWPVPGGHWTERLRPQLLTASMGWLQRNGRTDVSAGALSPRPARR